MSPPRGGLTLWSFSSALLLLVRRSCESFTPTLNPSRRFNKRAFSANLRTAPKHLLSGHVRLYVLVRGRFSARARHSARRLGLRLSPVARGPHASARQAS